MTISSPKLNRRPSPVPRADHDVRERPDTGRHRAILGVTPAQHLASRYIGDLERAQKFARRHTPPTSSQQLVARVRGGAA